MTYQKQVTFWMIALAVLILFLWLFRGILTPFVAGMAIAYLLDPVADRLEKLGFARFWATATIVGLFFAAIIIAILSIIPTLVIQTGAFLERLPTLIGQIQTFVEGNAVAKWLGSFLPVSEDGELTTSVSDLLKESTSWIASILKPVLSGGQALIGVISFLFISPIVAFYLLWDWDRMVARINEWLPRDHVETIRSIAHQIDEVLSGFVRGQVTVAFLLGSFYAIALSLLGLNFGLLIGIAAGILNIIPYVGSIAGFVIAVAVALIQFWPDYTMIIAVAAVFIVGQVAEGNFLQPVLVGDKVGLHPVWLMFGLIAFSSLFGLAGTLLAVPAAAAIGVLVRFGLGQYLQSSVYRGASGQAVGSTVKPDNPAGNI